MEVSEITSLWASLSEHSKDVSDGYLAIIKTLDVFKYMYDELLYTI
jgi:hypothetical protein